MQTSSFTAGHRAVSFIDMRDQIFDDDTFNWHMAFRWIAIATSRSIDTDHNNWTSQPSLQGSLEPGDETANKPLTALASRKVINNWVALFRRMAVLLGQVNQITHGTSNRIAVKGLVR